MSRSISLSLCLASSLGLTVLPGAPIIGYDSMQFGGTRYSINALNGAISAAGPGAGIARSSGPVPGTILRSSGGDIYELDVATGQERLYACGGGLCPPVGDLAFDSSTGSLYALATLAPLTPPLIPITVLLRLIDSGVPYPGVPGSTQIGYGFVGPLGVDGISTIEYVPGLGLVGTDGYNALFRIDTGSGTATVLAPLAIVLPVSGGISPINGLAYDPDTGRLLGSSPAGLGPGGLGLARLYQIDLHDSGGGMLVASAGWLNETPPSLNGIATVTPTPEPGTMALLMAGAGAWLLRKHSERRARV